MISDGNILRLLYFLFLILSSWSSIPCSSFNHTMANFENKNKWFCWMFSAASQIAEVELFFEALYLYSIYWECQGYSPPCLYLNFASVMMLCRVSSCVPSFSWRGRGVRGAFYTFSSFFLPQVGHRGAGDGTSAILCIPLLIFPVQSFLLLSCLSCFPFHFFLFNLFFFLLLVSCFYTLRPFQIVLLTSSYGGGRREIRRFVGRRV